MTTLSSLSFQTSDTSRLQSNDIIPNRLLKCTRGWYVNWINSVFLVYTDHNLICLEKEFKMEDVCFPSSPLQMTTAKMSRQSWR